MTELFSEKTSDGRRRYENSTAGENGICWLQYRDWRKRKNYGFLLRGIADLRQELGDEFHVLIIGEGSQKSELKVRASILGIQDVVTFMGNIPNDQVKDYLSASDAFLFASKSETQGIVLAEALAAGTPVVAVHATGTDDIIEDGVNGFLTEEREEEWAAKVIEALNEETNSRMKNAALISAEKLPIFKTCHL